VLVVIIAAAMGWTGLELGGSWAWAGRAALGEEAVGKDFFFLFLFLSSSPHSLLSM
jgi:hypothetical protein